MFRYFNIPTIKPLPKPLLRSRGNNNNEVISKKNENDNLNKQKESNTKINQNEINSNDLEREIDLANEEFEQRRKSMTYLYLPKRGKGSDGPYINGLTKEEIEFAMSERPQVKSCELSTQELMDQVHLMLKTAQTEELIKTEETDKFVTRISNANKSNSAQINQRLMTPELLRRNPPIIESEFGRTREITVSSLNDPDRLYTRELSTRIQTRQKSLVKSGYSDIITENLPELRKQVIQLRKVLEQSGGTVEELKHHMMEQKNEVHKFIKYYFRARRTLELQNEFLAFAEDPKIIEEREERYEGNIKKCENELIQKSLNCLLRFNFPKFLEEYAKSRKLTSTLGERVDLQEKRHSSVNNKEKQLKKLENELSILETQLTYSKENKTALVTKCKNITQLKTYTKEEIQKAEIVNNYYSDMINVAIAKIRDGYRKERKEELNEVQNKMEINNNNQNLKEFKGKKRCYICGNTDENNPCNCAENAYIYELNDKNTEVLETYLPGIAMDFDGVVTLDTETNEDQKWTTTRDILHDITQLEEKIKEAFDNYISTEKTKEYLKDKTRLINILSSNEDIQTDYYNNLADHIARYCQTGHPSSLFPENFIITASRFEKIARSEINRREKSCLAKIAEGINLSKKDLPGIKNTILPNINEENEKLCANKLGSANQNDENFGKNSKISADNVISTYKGKEALDKELTKIYETYSTLDKISQHIMEATLIETKYTLAILDMGKGCYTGFKYNNVFEDLLLHSETIICQLFEELKKISNICYDFIKEQIGEEGIHRNKVQYYNVLEPQKIL